MRKRAVTLTKRGYFFFIFLFLFSLSLLLIGITANSNRKGIFMIQKTLYAGILLSSLVLQAEGAVSQKPQSTQTSVKTEPPVTPTKEMKVTPKTTKEAPKAEAPAAPAKAETPVTPTKEIKVTPKAEAPEAPAKEEAPKKSLKLEIGKVPPTLTDSAKKLAKVSDGEAWSSKDFKDKLSIIFYVAPSEKDLNRHVTDAIKASVEAGKISRENYSSFAVVNMAASGWPNFILAMKLNGSQKEFPNTTYVKDYKKALVEEWGLKDESNDVLLIDKDGKVLFRYDGKVPESDVKKLVALLEDKAGAKPKAEKKAQAPAASKKAPPAAEAPQVAAAPETKAPA